MCCLVPWFQFQIIFVYLFSFDCCTVLRLTTDAGGVLYTLKYGGNLKSPLETVIMHSGCLGTKLKHPSFKARNYAQYLGLTFRHHFSVFYSVHSSCGHLSWKPVPLVLGGGVPRWTVCAGLLPCLSSCLSGTPCVLVGNSNIKGSCGWGWGHKQTTYPVIHRKMPTEINVLLEANHLACCPIPSQHLTCLRLCKAVLRPPEASSWNVLILIIHVWGIQKPEIGWLAYVSLDAKKR